MDTKQAWSDYHNQGIVSDDQILLAMIGEVVATIKTLERIYGPVRSQLMVRAMILDYQALDGMACHRNLKDVPRL